MSDATLKAPRNLSHIAIGVRDMDTALRFYRDVIGLEVTVDQTEDFNLPEARTYRRGVYLRWAHGDDAPFIVLDQKLDLAAQRGDAKELFEIGLHHFGFWVDDIDAIVARAEAGGHKVVIQKRDTDSGGYGEAAGKRIEVCMLRDPDGNFVQLDRRP